MGKLAVCTASAGETGLPDVVLCFQSKCPQHTGSGSCQTEAGSVALCDTGQVVLELNFKGIDMPPDGWSLILTVFILSKNLGPCRLRYSPFSFILLKYTKKSNKKPVGQIIVGIRIVYTKEAILKNRLSLEKQALNILSYWIYHLP